ncbi:MAG: alpha/beta hydrolase-fold protein [Pseudomonadota bacterium]|nr:alpha/beta hydrolase-fold protein [Pseudomonadota bacterium]
MINRRKFAKLIAVSAGAPLLAAAEETPSSSGSTVIIQSANVPSEARVHIHTPPGYRMAASNPYPLLILLHGGNGSEKDLMRFTGVIDAEMIAGRLPPMVIAMPGAGRSLYMDFLDGSQKWETFITTDLLAWLRAKYNVAADRHSTFIGGWSMGGLGSLRIAFKNPELFGAVAALEPAIEPALHWSEIGERVRFWRPVDLLENIFGSPIDTDFWASNNPATIAKRDSERLLGLGIYIEVGNQDMLYLHEGTEFLHRILFDAGVAHEYRLVDGAEHVGPSMTPRLLDALGFIGRRIDPPGWIDENVETVRSAMNSQKRAIGMSIERVDPRRIHGR